MAVDERAGFKELSESRLFRKGKPAWDTFTPPDVGADWRHWAGKGGEAAGFPGSYLAANFPWGRATSIVGRNVGDLLGIGKDNKFGEMDQRASGWAGKDGFWGPYGGSNWGPGSERGGTADDPFPVTRSAPNPGDPGYGVLLDPAPSLSTNKWLRTGRTSGHGTANNSSNYRSYSYGGRSKEELMAYAKRNQWAGNKGEGWGRGGVGRFDMRSLFGGGGGGVGNQGWYLH